MVKHFVAEFTIHHPKIEAEFTMPKNKPMEVEFTMQGATRDHTILVNRDKPDQHPISAITGLQDALDSLKCKTFVYEQGIASNTWVIEHNLGKIRPSITVVDSADTVIGLFNAEYVNDNKVILYFNGEFVGKAYLN